MEILTLPGLPERVTDDNRVNFPEACNSFPESTEAPHFEKASFRVKNKIFATLDLKNNLACIRLSPIDQDVFTAFDKQIIYPLSNNWGSKAGLWLN